jgi:hypothetical protein
MPLEVGRKVSRSVLSVAAGFGILFGGILALFVLPRITPFLFSDCGSLPGGGSVCSSIFNPIYPLVFVASMWGAVALFHVLFGRNFVLNPLFIIGMLSLSLGLLAVIFGYLDWQWECTQVGFVAVLPIGIACVHGYPVNFTIGAPFALAMVLGVGLIGVDAFQWRRNRNALTKQHEL